MPKMFGRCFPTPPRFSLRNRAKAMAKVKSFPPPAGANGRWRSFRKALSGSGQCRGTLYFGPTTETTDTVRVFYERY
ncbi:N-acetyltransferase 14 isoform X1 [Anopheles sinensis]|uniref:N-acetyltransferase 14 isoform X1 n=1 Tax=Anopheles sinensis TaxID=74873 RepID=A0A084VY88_ANOSI|nr:N-acetyltransferase 14 isoform X1 [Anopheles sinensis]